MQNPVESPGGKLSCSWCPCLGRDKATPPPGRRSARDYKQLDEAMSVSNVCVRRQPSPAPSKPAVECPIKDDAAVSDAGKL